MEMDGKILKLRIDWSEMDLLGHVNNIAISRYFQAARIHYMDQVGLKVFPGMETGPILAAAKVQRSALGWGEKTMVLPLLMAMRAL